MKRTILLTGANGNLGYDVVDALASEGHTLLAITGSGELSEEQKSKVAFTEEVDLSDESASTAVVYKIISDYTDVSVAILLAGGFSVGAIGETNEDMLDGQIALNFKTAWFVIRPLIEHWKKNQGGQIILMGARPAINPAEGKNLVAYALSKSLLFSLAEIINEDGKDKGIAASIIVPSILDTPPNRESMPDADFTHWVKTEDVAKTIQYILSDAGQQLHQPVFKMYNKA
jgi:NAD(P)-dependent dehydrogenase (short-subunit alcohol dehydrogenase family)